MSLEVEDGTGVDGAESYVSVADAQAYAEARGLAFEASPADDLEEALRRATQWIDSAYRARFPGSRANGRSQALEWPRSHAYDAAGEAIASTEVPVEVVNATIEAAVRELASPGILSPDLKRGGQIKSVGAGSARVEFAANAPARTTFSKIDGILSGLLGLSNALVGTASRS